MPASKALECVTTPSRGLALSNACHIGLKLLLSYQEVMCGANRGAHQQLPYQADLAQQDHS